MSVNMFIILAACKFLLALSMNFLPAFFFFQYMNNHVSTCPGMELNLGGP